MPPVEEGDIVALLNAGGYLQAMSSTHCLRPMGEARLPRSLSRASASDFRTPADRRVRASMRMSGRSSSRCVAYCGYLARSAGRPRRAPQARRRARGASLGLRRAARRVGSSPRPSDRRGPSPAGRRRCRGRGRAPADRRSVSACRRSACRGSAGRGPRRNRSAPAEAGRRARSWPGRLVGRTPGTRAERWTGGVPTASPPIMGSCPNPVGSSRAPSWRSSPSRCWSSRSGVGVPRASRR